MKTNESVSMISEEDPILNTSEDSSVLKSSEKDPEDLTMSDEDTDLKTLEDDPVLRWIGNFGKWQAKTIGIVQWVGLFMGWNMLSNSFLLPAGQSHWCNPPTFLNQNISASQTNQFYLKENNNSLVENNSLEKFKDTMDSYNKKDTMESYKECNCSRWVYDRSTYSQTVISEFDLVCNNEFLISLSQSIYMAGVMVGSVGSGFLSDKYGRKRLMLITSWLTVLFGVVASQSGSIFAFILVRWCLAVCNSSAFICGYVYCMEMVGGKWSTYVGSGLMFPWALGYISIPIMSWMFPDWRHLQLAITLPIILFIIPVSVPALVPESPRWLLFNGKREEATAILASAAAMNNRSLPVKSDSAEDVSTPTSVTPLSEKSVPVENVSTPTSITHLSEKSSLVLDLSLDETVSTSPPPQADKPSSMMDLFRSPRLRLHSVIMFYIWFTNSFIYYGLTLNSGSLIPGDLHVNFVIGGILEVVAYSVTIVALLRLGRRWSLSVTMVFAGLAMLLTAVVPDLVGKAICAQSGKFLITGSFGMMFVYAAELFPTVVRNVGVGSCSMFARVGGMMAPFIGKELGLLSKEAPTVIYGLTSLLAGLLVIKLPETKDKVLPDTIEEGENFGVEKLSL